MSFGHLMAVMENIEIPVLQSKTHRKVQNDWAYPWTSPWFFNLAFVAHNQPEEFLERHARKLATAKPLVGNRQFSKRDQWS